MTVFSVVLAWVSPKLLSAVDPAKREGLVEQLRSEAGVLVSLRQDDTLQVHGKWHCVQKAFGILEEVESFLNPEDESDDDDVFSSAANAFGSRANPTPTGQEQNVIETSDQTMLDIKPILPPPSVMGSGQVAGHSADSREDLEESVSDAHDAESNISDILEIVEDEDDDDYVVDDDDDDEDYIADVKVTPRSKSTQGSRRRSRQSTKRDEQEGDPSWKPSKRKRGRPRKITTTPPKRSPRSSIGDAGTPLNVRDFAVDVPKNEADKYMEMFKNCSATTPKGRGRGRPKLNESCIPEVVFVYSPRGPEKAAHNDPRFKDYIISKLETGATVADYIDQFDHLVKQNGDLSRIMETLKPDAEVGGVGTEHAEEAQERESANDGERDVGEKSEADDELLKGESNKDGKPEDDDDHEDYHEDESDQQQFMKALATVVQEVVEGGRKSFKCPKCDYTQSERNSVTRHIQRQHLMRRFLCLVCQRSCGTRPDMRKHLRRHREMHMCALCGMQYQDIRHMSEHLLTHKDGYVKPMFPCQQCEKIFSSKYVLKTHVESVHEGKKKKVPTATLR